MVDREPEPVIEDEPEEELLSPEVETQVAAAMGQLTRNAVIREGDDAQTVEGMVRDMLRPMLQNWLDDNLPPIVERIVEREIKRVSRGR